jgi:hypothetical protein
MAGEFHETLCLVKFVGADAEMRQLIAAMIGQNFDAIRSRVARLRAH